VELGLNTGIPPQVLMDQPDLITVTIADIAEARHRESAEAKRKAARSAARRPTRRRGR
jgi:hypothetical protein